MGARVVVRQARERLVLSDRLSGRDNAFGFMRLLLASSVIISHAYELGGFSGSDPVRGWTRGQTEIGDLAVLGFFVVSGYLITTSAGRMGLIQYLWRRTLRIFPAFLIVLTLSVLLVGPLFSPGDYWSSSPSPSSYFTSNWTLKINQYGIGETFTNTPFGADHGSVINGSLWTLEHEWRCYLVVGALAAFGILTRARWVPPILAVGCWLLAVTAPSDPRLMKIVWWTTATPTGARLCSMFFLGATFALFARQVPLTRPSGALAAGVATATATMGGFVGVGYIAFGYLIMWISAALPARFRKIGTTNDYSYGMYVYAFIVQQMLAVWGGYRWGVWPYVLLSIVGTIPLAAASWFLVERPMLRLKSRGPGRGWQQLRNDLHRVVQRDRRSHRRGARAHNEVSKSVSRPRNTRASRRTPAQERNESHP